LNISVTSRTKGTYAPNDQPVRQAEEECGHCLPSELDHGGFEYESDAGRFLDEMRERLQKFALSLHSEKTRLIEFGRLSQTPD
jgi:hypothetical protein